MIQAPRMQPECKHQGMSEELVSSEAHCSCLPRLRPRCKGSDRLEGCHHFSFSAWLVSKALTWSVKCIMVPSSQEIEGGGWEGEGIEGAYTVLHNVLHNLRGQGSEP